VCAPADLSRLSRFQCGRSQETELEGAQVPAQAVQDQVHQQSGRDQVPQEPLGDGRSADHDGQVRGVLGGGAEAAGAGAPGENGGRA